MFQKSWVLLSHSGLISPSSIKITRNKHYTYPILSAFLLLAPCISKVYFFTCTLLNWHLVHVDGTCLECQNSGTREPDIRNLRSSLATQWISVSWDYVKKKKPSSIQTRNVYIILYHPLFYLLSPTLDPGTEGTFLSLSQISLFWLCTYRPHQ